MNMKNLICVIVSTILVIANLSSSICHATAMKESNHDNSLRGSSISTDSSKNSNNSMTSSSSKSHKIKLLAISGSERKESANTKALHLLSKAAREAGAEVTTINLKDYPLPIYNG